MQVLKNKWNRNKEIYIWIFNVGRGFSSFIKTPHNHGVIIDCGATNDFHPYVDIIKPIFLPLLDKVIHNKTKFNLAQLIITHPHTDHISEIKDVMKHSNPMLLTTPHSNKTEKDLDLHVNWQIVNEQNSELELVKYLKDQINGRTPPLREYINDIDIQIPDFNFKIFYNKPKKCEEYLPKKDYTNNLSILVYLAVGSNSILFMGDMMPSGCDYLLQNNEEFRKCIEKGISIFVAPHHGLESAFNKNLFDLMPKCKVSCAHIISDKRLQSKTEGRPDNRYLSSLYAVGYGERYSFSTKNDGHIRIILGTGNKIDISTSNNIEDLLN